MDREPLGAPADADAPIHLSRKHANALARILDGHVRPGSSEDDRDAFDALIVALGYVSDMPHEFGEHGFPPRT